MRMSGGKALLQRLDLRQDRVGHGRRLHAGGHIGADRQDEISIAPPQDRFLEVIGDTRELYDGHGLATACQHGQIADGAEVEPLARYRARDDLDQLGAFPILGDLGSREQCLQCLRNLLRIEAEGTRAILVDFEAHALDLLVPIELRIDGIGFGTQ